MKTVLHTESSPGLGGQEIRTLDEARWIGERGWRVIVAAQEGGRLSVAARQAGIETTALPMRGKWDVAALRRLVRLIRAESVRIVHTHSSVDGWLGGLAARLAGVPVVRTRHVSIPIRRGWNPVYTKLADRVITSGEAIRALVLAAGVAPDRVVAIPAGVQLARFEGTANGSGADLLRSLGLARPVVGSVAMFRGSKGHDHLIEAFRLLHDEIPAVRLLLVGDGIRREWAEAVARERGVGDAVVFAGFRHDVPALLAAMDCFALASTRTEGVPQSLLQAFAAGTPVVATRIGGIPEVVEHGRTGLLVAAADPRALADALAAVLRDPAAARERAARARCLVEERFSHRASVGRLLALYEELIDGARPAR